MAGGRAARFGRSIDKSSLMVNGRTLLERTTDALDVDEVDEVLVATTTDHVETLRIAESLGIPVVITEGLGYHEDTVELLARFGRYVSVNVDVPFVANRHTEELVARWTAGSTAGVVPSEIAVSSVDPGSLLYDSTGREFIWIGLNIVSLDPHTALLEFDDPLLAVNVNDDHDLSLANDIAVKRGL